MAVTVEDWYELKLLDTVDITKDPAAEIRHLQAQLPKLEAALDGARRWVASALEPAPPWHPAHDTYNDQYYFMRAWNESDLGPRAAAVDDAQRQLDALRRSDDPGRLIAGWLLGKIHSHLKHLGLETAAKRSRSTPLSVGGLPLTEIIWQARNQDQHHNDRRDFESPVRTAFCVMVAQDPRLFGLTAPPPDDTALEGLLKQRSWAPESLRVLGWDNRLAVVEGVNSIAP
ncbi:hypothetical protein [Micromonospora echinospora]